MPAQIPVILFGYNSSPFTNKVRLALRLKQIPYDYVPVPSMMPRPVLRDTFGITYRKIPILAIGRDVYCDTSVIIEALEGLFPGTRSLYPDAVGCEGQRLRVLCRGFASYWTDRPLFRVATGLIPSSVWRTRFGTDRAGLIGHRLDPDKLDRKVSENLLALDTQLSILMPLFRGVRDGDADNARWIFNTPYPTLADLSLYYQLSWLRSISKGVGIENLTGGGTPDTRAEGADAVFNSERFPEMYDWFTRLEQWMESQPDVEERLRQDDLTWTDRLQSLEWSGDFAAAEKSLLVTPQAAKLKDLESKCGLVVGEEVTVAPDDTGREDPTYGTMLSLSPEEVVILPKRLRDKKSRETDATVAVRVHFPRAGFVVRPLKWTQPKAKL
ncbi:MAG: hypothetical protein M1828_001172 [Chrysothrix sp. TS-e1954]|nr:MAG: hypothetical protein M1828_001172 [Chrysothrix sp. TS-e1954]